MIALTICCIVLGWYAGGQETRVDDVNSLRLALQNAQAGDVIIVAPGLYAPESSLQEQFAGATRRAYFAANASGTPESPIVLKGEDPSDPPIIRGLTNANADYCLWIRGDHWQIKDLILKRGGKGLMLDGSSGSLISGLNIRNIGDEAIHLRSGTSNTVIEDSIVRTAGQHQPGFGEGIYIGSDVGQWDDFDRNCHNNIVRRCHISGTFAECIDVREATEGTIIEDCDLFGSRISGVNFADSFVDLKGITARVRNNRLYKEGNSIVTRGVAIVERPQGPTAESNWIYNNQFFLDDQDGVMVHAFRGAENYAWNNLRTPAGPEYQGNSPELGFEPQN